MTMPLQSWPLVTPNDPWGASQDWDAAVREYPDAESVDFDAYFADTSPGAPIRIVAEETFTEYDKTWTRATLSCGHIQDAILADGRVQSGGSGFVGVLAECPKCGVTA